MQDKLLAELDAQPFSKQDRIPTVHETRAMDYCGALLLESMRCKPTVPVNQRVNSQEDVVIGGVTIEKGTNVNIAAAVAFKDPKVFPDPERFNPERFLGESDAARAQVRALQAFGAHSRICIGMIMVKEELKAMLAALLRHHRVQLKDPNQSYESDIEAGVNMPPPDKEVQFLMLKR